jgi:hypothetical protein
VTTKIGAHITFQTEFVNHIVFASFCPEVLRCACAIDLKAYRGLTGALPGFTNSIEPAVSPVEGKAYVFPV